MTRYTLIIEDMPRSEEVQLLAPGLTAHTLPYTQVPGFTPLGVFLKDEHGVLVGGVWSQVNWNGLYSALVWVSEALRGGRYCT